MSEEKRDIGDYAGALVVEDHEGDDEESAENGCLNAFSDGVLAQRGADGGILYEGDRCGKGAVSEDVREVLRLFHREVAGYLGSAARDPLVYHRGRIYDVIEDDGEALAHVLPGYFVEDPRPFAREFHVHLGPCVELSAPYPHLGIGNHVAREKCLSHHYGARRGGA